jgi:hypothetical protein
MLKQTPVEGVVLDDENFKAIQLVPNLP